MSAESDYDARELRHLLAGLCDDASEAEDLARLEEILGGSPAARRVYLQTMDLHFEVGRRFEIEGAAVGERPKPGGRPARTLPIFAIAAALVATAAVATLVSRSLDSDPSADVATGVAAEPSGEPVAVIGSARGVVWNRDGVRPEVGVPLRAGAYTLAAGELGLGFVSGAEITIGAPADFVIISPMEIYLSEGQISAQVPPSAAGFTIRSKDMALVDIGTAFSANVRPTGISRVIVRDGEVVASVLGKNGATIRDYRATAGNGFEIDTGAVDIRPHDMGGESFVEPFEFQLPDLEVAATYPKAVIASAPVAYWRFASPSGDSVENVVGEGGRHAAIPFSEPGMDGETAGYFVGDPLPGLNGGGYTVECWISPRTVEHATLVGLIQPGWRLPVDENERVAPAYLSVVELTGNKSSADGIIQQVRALRFLHRVPPGGNTGTSAFSDFKYRLLRWSHVVAVQAEATLRIYVDGQLDQEVAHSSPVDDSGYQVVLGVLRPPGFNDQARRFTGKLDEVAIYDRPLGADEVAAHFAAAGR